MGLPPHQDWMGYPIRTGCGCHPLGLDGVPSCQDLNGGIPVGTGSGTPHWYWMGVSPSGLDRCIPIGTGWRYHCSMSGLDWAPSSLPSGLDGGSSHPVPMRATLPPIVNGWHMDRLCCGRYASCGFPQKDFHVSKLISLFEIL